MSESRLTFRDKATDICWQKQLRDNYTSEGIPPVPTLNLKQAVVRSVSRKLAEQIILKYEWLGTLPSGCTHYYGLFFGIYCAGVECVMIGGGGANVYAYKEFNLKDQTELAYLARGANVHWAPPGSNSKLVSWTCKLLRESTKAKLALAYSDTDAGEIGTVYQASNWVYIGKGSSTRQWVAPSGRIMDQKLASNIGKRYGVPRQIAVKELRKQGWREQESNPKHRYVYILDKSDKALVDRIEHLRKEYPKRSVSSCVPSVDGGTANDQLVRGGPIPTGTL